MAKLNIVIADSDEMYLNHLTNYLIEHVNTFEVYSFTTKESLVKFVGNKSNRVDIILFTADMEDGTIQSSSAPAKILLTDGGYNESEEYECINKYQKAANFVNNILMVYAEITGRVDAVTAGDKATKIIGFYSPAGGCGKTTLALATAYALGQMKKRVFYFNAERINSAADVLPVTESGSMSDVYLAVKTKGANVGLRIMSNKQLDQNTNINYINPSESSLEFNEISPDEFAKLVKEFEKLGEFDYVIFDFDSELGKEKIDMLSVMDKIVVPVVTDSRALAKTDLFIKEVGMYDELEDIKMKLCFVLNKSTPQSASALGQSTLTGTQQIKANISLSPTFADAKVMLHSGETMIAVMKNVVDNI